MSVSIKIPYRVREVFNVAFPQPLLDLGPRLSHSGVGPDVVYVEVARGEILMGPSINLRSLIDRSWVYHNGSKICFGDKCRDLGRILRAALIGSDMAIAITDKGGHVIEIVEDDIRARHIGIKDILGSVRYIDRSVVLVREGGLRRKISAIDQGFLYPVTSFCIERREGHSIVAFESGGYTRIYFGSEHGGYVIHDAGGLPIECSIGYRVATVGIRDRGSIYVGKNLYLEAPLRSVGVAWIPEDKILLLYDHKNGWLLESDLRSFKPIARLPTKPTYLGRLGDSHVLMMNNDLVVVKGSLMIRPEIRLEGSRRISVSSEGLVIDLGGRLSIRSIDGREALSINKDPEALCSGYLDKVVCIRRNMVGIVELGGAEISIEGRVNGTAGIVISGDEKISSVSIGGDVDVLNIARGDREIEVSIAPRMLGKAARSYVELEDIVSKHRAEIEIKLEPPTIDIENSVLRVARTGLHIDCNSPGYADVVLRIRGKEIHNLYRYVARVVSRDRVIGSSWFNIDLGGGGEEKTSLRICLQEQPMEGDTWLEIVAVRGDLSGDAFYRAPLAVEGVDIDIRVSLNHVGDRSELLVEIEGLGGIAGLRKEARVSVRCANTFFEEVGGDEGIIRISIGGCEAPARAVVNVEAGGFRWAVSREIVLRGLSRCVEEYSSIAGLLGALCSEGGFYVHLSPPSHEDLSPVEETRILNLPGRGTQILITARRRAAYSISILGRGFTAKQGSLYPGINIVDLGIPAELEPLRLSIFDGAVHREYLLAPESVEGMVANAVRTSYKLLELMGRLEPWI